MAGYFGTPKILFSTLNFNTNGIKTQKNGVKKGKSWCRKSKKK